MSEESLTEVEAAGSDEHQEYGALFWIGSVLGWIVIAYGVKLLFDDPEASWFNTARLVVLGIIAHDIVWLSVSVGAGWLCARLLGRPIPYWVRWGIWTSVIVIAMWLPLWRGYGDRIRNDTILPRNYGASIVILLSVVWAGAAAYELIRRRRV